MKTMKNKVRLSLKDAIFDKINIGLLFIIAFVIFYPLYYVFIASFTEPRIVSTGKPLFYPIEIYLGGFKRIFNYNPIWTGYANTIKYTAIGTIIAVCTTVPSAYALSRKDLFMRRNIIFLYTFTMFFQGGLIPLYLVITDLNIYNTLWAITLPPAVSVWNLIICRSYFESNIPDELLEAARLDGCNDFHFFFRIAVPLSSTIITVMILFYSTAIWNSFMDSLMFLRDLDKMPLPVILRNLILIDQASSMTSDVAELVERQRLADQMKFGIIVVSAFPLLCLYPFLQKYFTKGVMVGAIKG